MILRPAIIMTSLFLSLLTTSTQAAYIVTIKQVADDVIASGQGSLNVDLLTKLYNNGGQSSPSIDPADAIIGIGAGDVSSYAYPSDPEGFGSDVTSTSTVSTGLPVAFLGDTGSLDVLLLVPLGYMSGTDLGISTAVFEHASFKSLGITAGTYVYSFGNRTGVDTFTIDAVSGVPLPSSAPMFGAALMALGVVGYGLKRESIAAG